MTRYIFMFLAVLGLIGCSGPPMMVDRVLVKNATEFTVTEVEVRHEPTSRIGAVNAILPQKDLDIGFPKQPLLARQAFIGWNDGHGQKRSAELEVPYDSGAAKSERAMSLIYTLHSTGAATAHLEDSLLRVD